MLNQRCPLARHDGVRTDVGVVGYLNEIIEFYALANVSTAHRRTVYASVGSYLHVVLNGHNANLRNLVVLAGLFVRANPKPSAPITLPLWMVTLLPKRHS